MSYKTRFSIALAVLLCAGTAFAQNSNSGDIRGTVTDASGAVVPGVTVTVLDNDKGVAKSYISDGAGLYDTGSIVTDHYTLTFAKAGFDTYVRGPITLNNETLTVNGTLRVGSATETVTVTTDVALLDTESATQATTMAEQELNDLPSGYGAPSWEYFTTLMPGATGTSSPGAQGGNIPGQTASVNGNSVFYNVLGDGITMSLPSNGNSADYNFDTLQEVQMVTSVPSAQYENGGAIYNQISKGGGSSFHGDVFDYFQNSYLNAATYAFGQGYVPALRANYYGGSFSGPIPIGGLRKKLFFFFNYDRQQYYGGANSGFVTVPTAAMLAGDFTGMPTIYDPTTQKLVTSGTYQDAGGDPKQTCTPSSPCLERQSFASEYGNGNKIPTGLIDSVAATMETYFPKANVTNPNVSNGITTNNYFYNWASNSPSWGIFYRADYDITSKNRLTATDFYNASSSPSNGISICPIDCYTANGSARTSQISDVWTFSANMINEFRFGFSNQNNLYIPESIGKDYPTKLGLKFAEANLWPEVNINGACCFGGNMVPSSNAIQHQVMFEPSDVVTMIKGRHVLHFGGEFLDQQINATFWGNVDAGSQTYTGVYTTDTQGDAAVGLPYADFLLGQINSWSAANTPEFYPRMKTVQLFVQDDIKLKPNFTLNAGVRWEGWNGMYDAHGNQRSWDPTLANPGVDPQTGKTGDLGAMWYGSTHANGRTKVIAPIWNTFMPRFGFSWQMYPNTVIRGGIGLYAYNYNEGPSAYNELGSELGSSGNVNDNTNGILPVVILDQDGTVNDQGSAGQSIASAYQAAPTTPDALNGQGVNYAYYHEPLSKIWQYNVELQQELGPNMAFKLAYVGSHGFDQLFGVDLNQIPESALAPNDTAPPTDARPYPLYSSIGGNKLIGISNYNALQTTIDRRLSSGLQFNFNYTWSHFLNETDACAWNCATTYTQNNYDPRSAYGPSAFDVRSMFKGRLIYKLPVGKGQRFFSNSSLADATIGGWQTSATFQWQTGNPFTVVAANNTSFNQDSQYPNVVPGVNPYAGAHQIGPGVNWFNEAAFSQPPDATYGNSSRNSLRAPGYSNVNFSLGKNFAIWEKTVFLLRIDASNVLNHPSFGQPNANWGPGQQSSITSVTDGGRSVVIIGRLSF